MFNFKKGEIMKKTFTTLALLAFFSMFAAAQTTLYSTDFGNTALYSNTSGSYDAAHGVQALFYKIQLDHKILPTVTKLL